MSLDQLKAFLTRMQQEEGLRQAVLAAATGELAGLCYSLAVKSWAAGCQPTRWRGGAAVELHREGAVEQRQHYRASWLPGLLAIGIIAESTQKRIPAAATINQL